MNKCITIDEFHILSNEEKEAVIRKKAVFLDSRNNEGFRFELYQIDGFYIEMMFNLADDVFWGLRSFEEIDLLNQYLKKIKINFG